MKICFDSALKKLGKVPESVTKYSYLQQSRLQIEDKYCIINFKMTILVQKSLKIKGFQLCETVFKGRRGGALQCRPVAAQNH